MDNGESPLKLILSANVSRANAYAALLIAGVVVGMLFNKGAKSTRGLCSSATTMYIVRVLKSLLGHPDLETPAVNLLEEPLVLAEVKVLLEVLAYPRIPA